MKNIAEGCFMISIRKNPKLRTGWLVQAIFQIELHRKDLGLLKKIQSYFGGIGFLRSSELYCGLRIVSIDQLVSVILPHFENYPLITQKQADFELFKRVVYKMKKGEHLTPFPPLFFLIKKNTWGTGLQEIINIRSSINLGLSDNLKDEFPKTIPVLRPCVKNARIPNPKWMSGFTSFHKLVSGNKFPKLVVRVLSV